MGPCRPPSDRRNGGIAPSLSRRSWFSDDLHDAIIPTTASPVAITSHPTVRGRATLVVTKRHSPAHSLSRQANTHGQGVVFSVAGRG
jgi:hypothetical protein